MGECIMNPSLIDTMRCALQCEERFNKLSPEDQLYIINYLAAQTYRMLVEAEENLVYRNMHEGEE